MARKRILIIEDDVELCKEWASMLFPYFQVEYAATMKGGVARLDDVLQPAVECIYLDLMLPNGRGVNLVDKFQNRYPSIPIIVISGMDVDAEKVILAGAHAFLVKGGFTLEQLRDVTIQAVARHKVRGRFDPMASDVKEARKELSGLADLIDNSEPP
jgi:FixJ family two-component response regulator